MGEVKFGVGETQNESLPVPQTDGPAPAMEVAKVSKPFLTDEMPSLDQIRLPRINLVHDIGPMKDNFKPGSLVFGQSTVLWEPTIPAKINAATGNVIAPAENILPPVEVLFLGWRTMRYVEKTVGGARGNIVGTEQAVLAAGGTLDYQEWELKQFKGMKLYQHLAEAMVAIFRPERLAPKAPATEENESVFVHRVAGRKVALGLWAFKGTAYTHACKTVLFTARATGCLRHGGYPSFSFAASAVQKPFGVNKTWVPSLVPHSPTSPEVLAWVHDTLGVTAAPATAPADEAAATAAE